MALKPGKRVGRGRLIFPFFSKRCLTVYKSDLVADTSMQRWEGADTPPGF
jgi:hypothetical protein